MLEPSSLWTTKELEATGAGEDTGAAGDGADEALDVFTRESVYEKEKRHENKDGRIKIVEVGNLIKTVSTCIHKHIH